MSGSGGARDQPLPANILLPARLGHTSARRRALLTDAAPGDRRRASGGTLLLIRRQTGLSRGVKDILVTGITVTSLLTSAATASAQNFFGAVFARPGFAPGPVPDANFPSRDRRELATPPYRQAWIAPAYRRQVVRYHRKESPGTILVDTAARYVYYVLPEGKAIR